jgi:hypothetical protein
MRSSAATLMAYAAQIDVLSAVRGYGIRPQPFRNLVILFSLHLCYTSQELTPLDLAAEHKSDPARQFS